MFKARSGDALGGYSPRSTSTSFISLHQHGACTLHRRRNDLSLIQVVEPEFREGHALGPKLWRAHEFPPGLAWPTPNMCGQIALELQFLRETSLDNAFSLRAAQPKFGQRRLGRVVS